MTSETQASTHIDEASLAVVDLVTNRFEILTTGVGFLSNIYIVFFHDLVVHFTGILMHRSALQHYPDVVRFPWVNQGYARLPYMFDPVDLQPLRKSHGLKSSLRRFPFSGTALGEALPFGYPQEKWQSRLINLLSNYKPFTQAYLYKRDDQVSGFLDTVDELCRLHTIQNADVVRENWRRYVDLHTTHAQPILRDRALLLGTRNNLQNRKLAVNYLQQDKEVVAITHGEVANSVMDEPPFGYSERTLCSTLVDYGTFDRDGDFNTPLILPKRRFYRSSPMGRLIYRRRDDIRLPDRRQCRTLYIPTTYSGNSIYGPFHIFEDAVYRQWQDALFRAFSDLTLKAHPKSRSKPLAGIKIERRQLEDCIANYDVLVFDYFATGSMLAMMSDKPVIYFNIGLRKLLPEFEKDIKSRCEYAKINLHGDTGMQVTDALDRFWSTNDSRSNASMARYALCEEEHFNWVELLKATSNGDLPPW